MVAEVPGLTPWAHALVALLAGAGMLLIVPLGLALIAVPGPVVALVRRWWPVVALPAAVSLWLPRGLLTATLAVPYLTAASILLLSVALDVLEARVYAVRELALLTALSGPVIAACALVAERAGYRLFGFDLDTLLLTVAHFHYAGFAAALVTALLVDRRPSPLSTIAACCVPAGTLIVLLGYFLGDPVQLAGAAVLTAGLWLAAGVSWRDSRGWATRALLVVGAITLAGTMLLALDWALGSVTGLPHLSLSWMAATHGVANAIGFALCSLLAWRRDFHRGAGAAFPANRYVERRI